MKEIHRCIGEEGEREMQRMGESQRWPTLPIDIYPFIYFRVSLCLFATRHSPLLAPRQSLSIFNYSEDPQEHFSKHETCKE